jgi:EPS-associated MarR family transcriptional regulator
MTERSPPATAAPDIQNDAHLELLRLLEQHPEYSQRDMAKALGVSVGKTHYVLKALLSKGLVKAQNFQRSPNKLGYLYRLTPSGVAHRLQLTHTFLARKENEYRALRGEIATLRGELAAASVSHPATSDR